MEPPPRMVLSTKAVMKSLSLRGIAGRPKRATDCGTAISTNGRLHAEVLRRVAKVMRVVGVALVAVGAVLAVFGVGTAVMTAGFVLWGAGDALEATVDWAEGRIEDPRMRKLFLRMAERSGIEHRW